MKWYCKNAIAINNGNKDSPPSSNIFIANLIGSASITPVALKNSAGNLSITCVIGVQMNNTSVVQDIGSKFLIPLHNGLMFLISTYKNTYIINSIIAPAITFSYIGLFGLVKNLIFVTTVSWVVNQPCAPISRKIIIK